MTLTAKRPARGLALLPAMPVGHLGDGEILELIAEDQHDPRCLPRGELRFFSSRYQHVCVLVMHQGRLRWIPLLAPRQRDVYLHRRRSRPPEGIWTWSRLLSCIDRTELRWYPYHFDKAAFSRNEEVLLRFGEHAWEGKIQGSNAFPDNGYPETTYTVLLVETHTQVYALEHQVQRLVHGATRSLPV